MKVPQWGPEATPWWESGDEAPPTEAKVLLKTTCLSFIQNFNHYFLYFYKINKMIDLQETTKPTPYKHCLN